MNKIKLNVLGISYSQTQTGAYALVLAEENGNRRIPIIVGGFEAQAIAIQLEGLKPPRPLTHDLFLNFARTFSIEILEVTVYKLEEGVFSSKLTPAMTAKGSLKSTPGPRMPLHWHCVLNARSLQPKKSYAKRESFLTLRRKPPLEVLLKNPALPKISRLRINLLPMS
jgi:hypothetical protein